MAAALVVHAHPEPTSFSSFLKNVSCSILSQKGYSVTTSDLYQENFDAVEAAKHYPGLYDHSAFSPLREQRHAWKTGQIPADVAREIGRLERADLVVFHFPLWWHAQPAILKGWFDRVFLSGGLYTSEKRYDRGYFKGKSAVAVVTTGAPSGAFGPNARGGDMGHMLWPFHYSLHYLGFSVLPPFLAHGIQGHGYTYAHAEDFERRLRNLMIEWQERLSGIEGDKPIWFPGWSDWDENGAFRGEAGVPGALDRVGNEGSHGVEEV